MQNVDDNLKYYHTYPYTTSIYLCFFWAPQLFLGPLCATSFKESSKDLITQIAIISDNYFITNMMIIVNMCLYWVCSWMHSSTTTSPKQYTNSKNIPEIIIKVWWSQWLCSSLIKPTCTDAIVVPNICRMNWFTVLSCPYMLLPFHAFWHHNLWSLLTMMQPEEAEQKFSFGVHKFSSLEYSSFIE